MRKKLAVITARADDSSQSRIITGICAAALSYDTDVIVFSNLYNYVENDDILAFENVIYDFFQPRDFDCVIVTAEAFFDKSLLYSLIDKIKSANIPCTVIGENIPGFYYVDNDDITDMELITTHLIKNHGFKDIDILTGPFGNDVAENRLSGCKNAFIKNGLDFSKVRVFYGDFWLDSGEQLAHKYLSGELSMPRAVICANDSMAFGLCDVLSENGVEIPKIIAVTGYDTYGERIYHNPIITTLQRKREEMGVNAFKSIYPEVNISSNEENEVITGLSCGCEVNLSYLEKETRRARIGKYFNMTTSETRLSDKLTLCLSLKEYCETLADSFYLLFGAKQLYLCLDKNWQGDKYAGDEFLCCNIKGGQEVSSPLTFTDNKEMMYYITAKENPGVYYYSPLRFQKRLYGFTVLYYDYVQCYDVSYRDYIKTVANALEFLRLKNDIDYLTACRRDYELYDSLNGFYNLREFSKKLSLHNTGFIYGIRLSFLAQADYTYGEGYKNEIITHLARGIKKICRQDEILCHDGKGNFLIFRRTEDKKLSCCLDVIIYNVYTKTKENTILIAKDVFPGKDIKTALSELCLITERGLEKYSSLTAKPHYNALCEIRHKLYKDPEKALSADTICRRLCISGGYLRALYKQYFGIPYNKDVINARILLGRYLLSTTAAGVYSIAKRCGYNDEKYFTRQFTALTGYSPIKYRTSYEI